MILKFAIMHRKCPEGCNLIACVPEETTPSGACCVSVVKDMGSETLEFEGRITILFFASYHGDAPFLQL